MIKNVLKIFVGCSVFAAILSYFSCAASPGSGSGTTTVIYDNFNRVNGPIGGNWILNFGSVTIINNQAVFAGTSIYPNACIQSNCTFSTTYYKLTADYNMDLGSYFVIGLYDINNNYYAVVDNEGVINIVNDSLTLFSVKYVYYSQDQYNLIVEDNAGIVNITMKDKTAGTTWTGSFTNSSSKISYVNGYLRGGAYSSGYSLKTYVSDVKLEIK